jgi:hypothetical protein
MARIEEARKRGQEPEDQDREPSEPEDPAEDPREQRHRGNPGEPWTTCVLVALAEALAARPRRWLLLLELRKAVYPPVVSGRTIEAPERRHLRRQSQNEQTPSAADRLRRTVIRHRKRPRHSGPEELRALKVQIEELRGRLAQ